MARPSHVSVNGNLTQVTPPYNDTQIYISNFRSGNILAELHNGISVVWGGGKKVHISVPLTFLNNTKGLYILLAIMHVFLSFWLIEINYYDYTWYN